MTRKSASARRAALAASIFAILILTGAAIPVTTAVPEGLAPVAAPVQASTATVLEYKMPNGRVLTYKNSEEMAQVMEVMGQTMESTTTSGDTFTFKAKGRKDQNLLLGVTIDEMSMTTTGPEGDESPDMGPVKGKTFDMVLSPLGKEVDVSAAEDITYISATGQSNVSSDFKLFFPDLPGQPVRVGDSWTSSAGADDKSERMNIRMDVQYVSTLEGFETVELMECARIRSQVTATISGTGNQEGMDMAIAGTGKGTDLWYFAIKEGIYVRSTAELALKTFITVSAQDMTIPMTQTAKAQVKLIGKK
jgi:hypothetical protein